MIYPNIDPVAFKIFNWPVHWYGITYLVAITIAYVLLRVRARQPHYQDWNKDKIADLVFYCTIGVVVGGRLGYVFFYGLGDWSKDYLYIFKIWQGGMSFHGGLLGVIIAMGLFARNVGKGFFEIADYVAPVTPLGLGSGRIGNFINNELWGKPTEWPTGIRIPFDCSNPEFSTKYNALCKNQSAADIFTPPLHPAQLYEFVLEGLVLFLILWLFTRKARPLMVVSGMFLLWYGIFRFVVEFVRVPDAHLGYQWFGWVTRGQQLSMPMIIVGAILIYLGYRRYIMPKANTT